MKSEIKCKSSQPADPGLSVEQRRQLHAGWIDAMKGVPFTQENGALWTEGFVNYHLFKSDPKRSWLRH